MAMPAGQLLADSFFGTSKKLKPDKYDPQGAKKLLAEAGYPNGFGLTLHAPNDRYINDAKIAQAVAQMLTRVGIDDQGRGDARQRVLLAPRGKPEFSIRLILVGWGSGTGETSARRCVR